MPTATEASAPVLDAEGGAPAGVAAGEHVDTTSMDAALDSAIRSAEELAGEVDSAPAGPEFLDIDQMLAEASAQDAAAEALAADASAPDLKTIDDALAEIAESHAEKAPASSAGIEGVAPTAAVAAGAGVPPPAAVVPVPPAPAPEAGVETSATSSGKVDLTPVAPPKPAAPKVDAAVTAAPASLPPSSPPPLPLPPAAPPSVPEASAAPAGAAASPSAAPFAAAAPTKSSPKVAPAAKTAAITKLVDRGLCKLESIPFKTSQTLGWAAVVTAINAVAIWFVVLQRPPADEAPSVIAVAAQVADAGHAADAGGHGEAKKDDGHGAAKKDDGHGKAKKDDGHGASKKAEKKKPEKKSAKKKDAGGGGHH